MDTLLPAKMNIQPELEFICFTKQTVDSFIVKEIYLSNELWKFYIFSE